MGSLTLLEGTKSSSLMGMGGGSSPLGVAGSLGVMGDFGVLPPEAEVRGEGGGLSFWEELGLDFRSTVSRDAMAMGEAVLSVCGPTEGAARFKRRVHVTMSVLSSV